MSLWFYFVNGGLGFGGSFAFGGRESSEGCCAGVFTVGREVEKPDFSCEFGVWMRTRFGRVPDVPLSGFMDRFLIGSSGVFNI